MHNIRDLEERWQKYNRSRVIIYTLIGICIALLALALYVWIGGDNEGSKQKTPTQSIATDKPSRENVSIAYKDKSIVQKAKANKKPKIDLKVSENHSKDSEVMDVKERFGISKDPMDALFVAKYYYDKNDCKQAQQWALDANRIDSTIEDSWVIFAKCKAKNGDRLEALNILKEYLKIDDSKNIHALIDEIKKGDMY